MESRYVDADAARAMAERAEGVSELLALRTYTARLLGSDPTLVLHGGGNTSVKAEATTIFGETVDVLHIKGSGWDLATIEPPGHPAVRTTHLAKLLALPEMSDEQMVNELRLALLDAAAPTPSVETLLHAALPARFIDHTHANAVLAIVDQDRGEAICRELYGDALLWIPYVMPGFGLARACKRAWDGALAEGRKPTVMVLQRHGIFTFGDTAKESYERMIDAVTRAERYADDRMGTVSYSASVRDEGLAARAAAIVRGALAKLAAEPLERGPIVTTRANDAILAFLDRRDARDLTQRGCATPDHVIRTKPTPLFVDGPTPTSAAGDSAAESATDLAAFAVRVERGILEFAARYDRYFEEMVAAKAVTKTKLDPWPRIILVPKVGILAVGKTRAEAEIAADVYEHTLGVIADAEDVGTYAPLGLGDLFDVEYWSLEQAKVKKETELPLAKRVALVTGAASGIGRATVARLLALGAHVVASDRDEPLLASALAELGAKRRKQLVTAVCDVTKRADVERTVRLAASTFGGLDIVVSNAGYAAEGRLDETEGDRVLRESMEVNLLAHNTVAAAAVETMRLAGRGGCLLFNASKSAFNQGPGFGPYAVAKAALVSLMRQYAVDLANFGIRANAVNADRIRTAIFAHGVVESRAAKRGLTVDDYFKANLLAREVTAADVADAFAWLATARATTGCVVTVDGGNSAAFPR